jgi:hypothetical protein
MDKYYQHLVFKLRLLNAFAWTLIVLSLVSIWIYLVLIPDAKQEINTLNRTINNKPSVVTTASPNEVKVSDFYRALPTSAQVKEMLSVFYMEMEAQELELSTMQFSLEESPDMRFATYRFSAPIYGDYLGVMQAVKNLLEKNPTLAVKNIRLSRENIKESAINANIDFAIYLIKD